MILAVDTETTGLYPFSGDRPFMITTYDSLGAGRALYIGKDDLVPLDCYLMGEGNEAVFHNAKFDLHMLETIGMRVGCKIHDTMVMAHIYNPNEPNKQLKVLAKKYLGEEPADEKAVKDWLRKNKTKRYDLVPHDIMEPYAINDTRITYGLFKFYEEKGVTEDATYLTEMKLLNALLNMERRGVPVDLDYVRSQAERCDARIAEVLEYTEKTFGDVNLGSNVQLKDFLFNKEGLACTNYTPKGNPCLDQYNLHLLKHPIIPYVLEFRDLSKVRSTYLDYMLEHHDSEQAIHCSYFQVGAKTGRLSCREPNLQNIPVKGTVNIRRAFTVRPGYTNYYLDYSQIELRLLAHYSKEQKMIDAYLNDEDLHELTARGMFNGECDKEKRNMAKRLNFGIIYGIGGAKFVSMIHQEYPEIKINVGQAKEYISRYFRTYPGVSRFISAVKSNIFMRANVKDGGVYEGYVTDIFGRRYLCDTRESYKAVNYLIQGCAAGIIKKAMIDIDTFLASKKSNVLLTIHDELVIEVHNQEEELVQKIVDIMEDRNTFRVPILVNVEKTSTNWEDKASVEAQSLATAVAS